MAKNKRSPLFWFFLGMGCFIVLVFLILMVLPAFLNLNFVKYKISQELKERYQVSAQIASISLRFLPSPKVVLTDTQVTSDKIEAYLPMVSAYPKLWPILHKKLEIDTIVLEKPGLKVFLTPKPKKPSETLIERLKKQGEKLSALSFKADLQLKNASLEVLEGQSCLFKADSINLMAEIKDNQILLETSFNTPFSQEVLIKGRANLGAGLEGRAHFKKLNLEHFPFTTLTRKIVKTEIDLDLTFDLESPAKFNLGFNLACPCFKTQDIFLKGGFVQGTALRKENAWELNISRLGLENPRVEGQGWLAIDLKKYKIAYNFEGQELDATGLRNLLCNLFPQNQTVKDMFSIVKTGRIRDFHMSQVALSKSEFKNLKNLKIDAQVITAEVDIPTVELKVHSGQGKITFKEGILYGENLSGIVEGAKLREAKIAIGIKDPSKILNLQGHFTASLETGLFFLKRFVKTDSIQKELGLISKAEGTLSGAVAIIGTSNAVDVGLKASLIKGNILYQRLPYPALIDKIDFSYDQKKITWQGLKGHLGHSTVSKSNGEVDLSTEKVFINIKSFSGKLIAHELNPWSKQQNFLKDFYQDFDLPQGKVEISSANLIYKFGESSSLSYALNFSLRDSILSLSFLPKEAQIESGQGSISSQLIRFNDTRGLLGNGSFIISGEIKEPFTEKRQIKLWGEGEITAPLGDWVYRLANIPDSLKIKTPARVESFKLDYSPENIHLETNLFNQQGIAMGFSLDSLPKEFSIKEFYLKENDKECYLSLDLNWQKDFLIDLNFRGTLSSKTLDAMLVQNKYLTGIFTGEIEGKVDFSHPRKSELTGHLLVEELANIKGLEELMIGEMNIKARGQEVELEKVALSLKETALEGQGRIKFTPDFLEIKGEVFASVINWDEISKFFSKKVTEKNSSIKLKGEINAEVDLLCYDNLTFEQIGILITLEETEEVRIEVWKGHYCHLDLTGLIKAGKDELALHISVQGEDQDLNNFFYCLSKKRGLFDANYSLKGEFKTEGRENPLQENSAGHLEFHSEKGRIYKFTLLAKIFSLLNVLEIFKGRLPDLGKEGLHYKHFDVSANLKNGILAIDSAVIDSPAMKIVGQGTFNTANSELKMTILVAPLRTIDILLSKIPILGGILTGKSKTFISVPLEVKGPIQDPFVKLLPPSAIGKGILGIMKRFIGVPIEIFKPLKKE